MVHIPLELHHMSGQPQTPAEKVSLSDDEKGKEIVFITALLGGIFLFAGLAVLIFG